MKHTNDCGLVFKPNYDACKVDAYLDADFDGMYGKEEPNDHARVKRCTRFIIMFADYPVLWVSKLHTENAL